MVSRRRGARARRGAELNPGVRLQAPSSEDPGFPLSPALSTCTGPAEKQLGDGACLAEGWGQGCSLPSNLCQPVMELCF